jgi:ribose-phosphate pyrophosphokinase
MLIINDASEMVWNETKRFTNGELSISPYSKRTRQDGEPVDYVNLYFFYRGDESIVELYMVGKYLKGQGRDVNLKIAYMPYSRMDKVNNKYEPFTLKYMCDLINSVGFDRILVFEPHSDVTMALLNNAEKVNFLPKFYYDLKNVYKTLDDKDYVFFPDTEVQKRYDGILPNKSLVGMKNRIVAEPNCLYDMHRKIFIVDEICSKGTRALYAANELRKFGFKEVNLIVAHCGDSIFDGELLKEGSPINHIYTTDSILTGKHEKLVIMSIVGHL